MDVAKRIREVSQLSGDFTLRSGAVSDTYFDKYLFESDPQLLRAIAKQMAENVPPGTEILAGLEMGGIPVVTALSFETGIPASYIRKKRKAYGTAKYAEGPELIGKNVLVVEDVVSSGGAILDALRMLREDGIEPHTALCVIDRQTGGKEALEKVGVQLRSMLTMSEILNT
jgi:orotate phosphoribosyltransferase